MVGGCIFIIGMEKLHKWIFFFLDCLNNQINKMQSNNIRQVANLLQEASNILNTNATQLPPGTPSNSNNATADPQRSSASVDLVSSSVSRASNMMSRASSSGIFRRMRNPERLRCSSRSEPSSRTSRSSTSSAPKKKAMEFALIKSSVASEEDNTDCDSDTLKWDSKLAEGIMMVHEYNTEEEIRVMINTVLSKKFPLMSKNDFEFVKVRQKIISVPQLSLGTEFNYAVIKKLAGQGSLYVRLKAFRSFLLDKGLDSDNDEASLVNEESAGQSEPNTTNVVGDSPVNENPVSDVPIPVAPTINTPVPEVPITVALSIDTPVPDIPIPVALSNTPSEPESPSLVHEIKSKNLCDPVEILRFIQGRISHGRALHMTDLSDEIEGQTNFISVDRDNMISTTFDELKYIEDFTLTFEVDFIGEMARDLGGPRLEWIEIMNREMREKYFSNGLREQLYDHYYFVGVMAAIAMLQNGTMPRIFDEVVLNFLFDKDSSQPSKCIKELQRGFEVFGLQTIFHAFPVLRHLLQPSQFKLTPKFLMQTLKPQFSPEGSTALAREKNLYTMFVKYIREVASGRRGTSLASILQFVTSCSEEPILGYALQPSINFVASSTASSTQVNVSDGNVSKMLNYTPTCHTCSNTLILPRGDFLSELPSEDYLYNIYDLAFSSNYFGVI